MAKCTIANLRNQLESGDEETIAQLNTALEQEEGRSSPIDWEELKVRVNGNIGVLLQSYLDGEYQESVRFLAQKREVGDEAVEIVVLGALSALKLVLAKIAIGGDADPLEWFMHESRNGTAFAEVSVLRDLKHFVQNGYTSYT